MAYKFMDRIPAPATDRKKLFFDHLNDIKTAFELHTKVENSEETITSLITTFLTNKGLYTFSKKNLNQIKDSNLEEELGKNLFDFHLANETFHFIYKYMAKNWDQRNGWKGIESMFDALSAPNNKLLNSDNVILNNEYAALYLYNLCNILPDRKDEHEQLLMGYIDEIFIEILPKLTIMYRKGLSRPGIKKTELDKRFKSALNAIFDYIQITKEIYLIPSYEKFRKLWQVNHPESKGKLHDEILDNTYFSSLVKTHKIDYKKAIEQIEEEIDPLLYVVYHGKSGEPGGRITIAIGNNENSKIQYRLTFKGRADSKEKAMLMSMCDYMDREGVYNLFREKTRKARKNINEYL